MAAPLVAVPSYHLPSGRVVDWARGGYAVPEGYVASVRRAGGLAVIVPAATDEPPEDVLLHFDALLLAGGGDVEPERYGAADHHPRVYGVDPVRDEAELALVRAALAQGLPTLAICRGMQVLNVALGGTLHQHLPDLQGIDLHGHPTRNTSVLHDVTVVAGSRLAVACGTEALRCTSQHHQAVDRVADGLVPVAWSADGLVEGLEPGPDGPWLVAVQWHPEMTSADDPAQQAIFDRFLAVARAGAGGAGVARGHA